MLDQKAHHRILARARKSLYGFPVEELSSAQVFLFAGWLRLEEKAKAELCREYRASAKRSQQRSPVFGASGP